MKTIIPLNHISTPPRDTIQQSIEAQRVRMGEVRRLAQVHGSFGHTGAETATWLTAQDWTIINPKKTWSLKTPEDIW